jgi:hypothetical protein
MEKRASLVCEGDILVNINPKYFPTWEEAAINRISKTRAKPGRIVLHCTSDRGEDFELEFWGSEIVSLK